MGRAYLEALCVGSRGIIVVIDLLLLWPSESSTEPTKMQLGIVLLENISKFILMIINSAKFEVLYLFDFIFSSLIL